VKKVRGFWGNALALILFLALGLGAVLFLRAQSYRPAAQQEPGTVTAPVSPLDTPQATRVATVIPVIITTIATPTPAPSPTPTPTFEPLSDKPIMGFVFKPPQEIANTRNSVGYYEIVDWLPGNSEEVLVKGPLTLETVNVLNGTVKQYATFSAPGAIDQPIWLPEAEGVAYLSSDIQTNKTNLWLGQAEGKTEALLSDVQAPLIPVEKGRGVAVYSKNDRAMRAVSPNKQNLKPIPEPVTIPLPKIIPDKLLYTAYQPGDDWIAYYNIDGFHLVNSKSREVRLIDLGGDEFGPLWVKDAKWSPDGQTLALIVTQGRSLFHFSDLYILEWPAATLRKVNNTFDFVTGIAWAPDSKHLLLKAVIDQRDGFNINALYITDISAPSEIVPVPIPIEGLTGFGALSWSPDGQTVLVQYFDGREVALHRIDVTTQ
jgi:WD40 repeat protein